MKKSNLIAIDLAKNTHQVCLFDKHDNMISNKSFRADALRRFLAKQQASLVAFEGCGGAHHYARLALSLGHDVVIYPAKVVANYRQGHKTDANDAKAIAYTARQPSLKTVAVKNLEQQNVQSLLRIQQHLSDQLTATSNLIRGLLLEFGIRIPKGHKALKMHLPLVMEDGDNGLAFPTRHALNEAWQIWQHTRTSLTELEKQIEQMAQTLEACQNLLQLEGVGAKNALALYADIGDGKHYKNGRAASACIGATPTQHSTGGKERIGHIRKGYLANKRLRSTLTMGAIAVLNVLEKRAPRNRKELWLKGLLERRGKGRAAVALVNKTIRTAWAMLAHNEAYKPSPALI